MFDSIVKIITGWVRLRGNTDDTFIGNTSDSLKVAATIQDDAFTSDFNRLRVAAQFTIFAVTFNFDKQDSLFTEVTATGGNSTFNNPRKATALNVTTASGSRVYRRTRRYLEYFPGQTHRCTMSVVPGAQKTNNTKRWGIFDTENGMFFENNGSETRVVIRTDSSGSPVNTAISQSNWNIDRFDGTGPSGVTLNLTKLNVFIIDYSWHGAGRVRFGIIVNGLIKYCHEFDASNISEFPYTSQSIFPLAAEIVNTGTTASASTLYFNAASYSIEYDDVFFGNLKTANTGVSYRTVPASGNLAILSIRKKSANIKQIVKIVGSQLLIESNDEVLVTIVKNGTLTGASWVSNSDYVEKDISASSVTGGEEIFSFYVRGGAGTDGTFDIPEEILKKNTWFVGSLGASTSEIFTIKIESLTGLANSAANIEYTENS